MNYSFFKQNILLSLLFSFVFSLTSEEYQKEIETHIKTLTGVLDDSLLQFICPQTPDEKSPITNPVICISGLDPEKLNFIIEFKTPLETAKLVANNVDLKEKDDDFEIESFLKHFIKNSKRFLGDQDLSALFNQKTKEIATKLSLTIIPDTQNPDTIILALNPNDDKRSNNIIYFTFLVSKLTLSFKTNFFTNSFTLSNRHSLFFETEIERGLISAQEDLQKMKRLLSNDPLNKDTLNLLNCNSIFSDALFLGKLNKRTTDFKWTLQKGLNSIRFTSETQKSGDLSCEDFLTDTKIPYIKFQLKYSVLNNQVLKKTQVFIKESMYDFKPIIETFFNDSLTFLFRFFGTSNPEESIDFNKTPLIENKGNIIQADSPGTDLQLKSNVDTSNEQGRKLEKKVKTKK